MYSYMKNLHLMIYNYYFIQIMDYNFFLQISLDFTHRHPEISLLSAIPKNLKALYAICKLDPRSSEKLIKKYGEYSTGKIIY
jgi:hypothetical protein